MHNMGTEGMPMTRDGNKYFIIFVDNGIRFCYLYLLKSKDEIIEKFELYKNEVET